MSESPSSALRSRLAFAGIVAIYLALLLPSVMRHGIGWDEQTDLGIALTYLQQPGGWLLGSDVDPINVRLPMVASALVFALVGQPSLAAARGLSCLLGVLTLAAVYSFCRRELDVRKARLAVLILATSPYFLAYSRAAFSEGDIFVTCALAWLLVCLGALRRRPRLGRAALTGLALGAATASKISAVAAIPAVAVAVLWPAAGSAVAGGLISPRVWRTVVGLLAVLFTGVIGGWELAGLVGAQDDIAFLAGQALVVVALFVAVLAVAARNRDARLDKARLLGFLLAFGGATFFALPPVHTTNPDIFRNLIGAFLFSNLASPAAFAFEAAALHFAVIAIKPSLGIGLAAWTSLGLAGVRVRRRPELALPLVLAVAYILFLLRLPWAQPFYMLPTFPVLAILVADAGVELFDRRRAAACTLGALTALLLAVDLVRCAPDFHLNGYQWVGARISSGRPTLGARSLVPVPTDGAEQALRWVREHARPGDTLLTFVRPWHIRDAVLEGAPLHVVDGLETPGALARADFVVTTLGAEINHGYGADDPSEVFAIPYDAAVLRRDFTRVFRVERAFNLEVAAVWQRERQR